MIMGLDSFKKYAMDQAGFAPPMYSGNRALDAAVSGGLAFVVGELEKPDLKIREPLASVTYAADMPIKIGGGWIEHTSNLYVDYQISGPNLHGIQANRNTNIPIMQANLTKDLFPVFNWQNQIRINFIDLKKLESIPRSMQEILDKGVRLNWNLALQEMVYNGLQLVGGNVYGLFNDPAVTTLTAAATGTAGSTLWINKTAQEIMQDYTTLLTAIWAAGQYSPEALVTRIAIPPAQFAYLVNTIVTVAGYPGGVSIMKYLMENNLIIANGGKLAIVPRRQLIGAGTGGSDRMCAYVDQEDKIVMDLPVPCEKIMTMPAIENAGGVYNTLFAGQIGVVKKLYLQTIAYMDGI